MSIPDALALLLAHISIIAINAETSCTYLTNSNMGTKRFVNNPKTPGCSRGYDRRNAVTNRSPAEYLRSTAINMNSYQCDNFLKKTLMNELL